MAVVKYRCGLQQIQVRAGLSLPRRFGKGLLAPNLYTGRVLKWRGFPTLLNGWVVD
jgi:hypothetical protein